MSLRNWRRPFETPEQIGLVQATGLTRPSPLHCGRSRRGAGEVPARLLPGQATHGDRNPRGQETLRRGAPPPGPPPSGELPRTGQPGGHPGIPGRKNLTWKASFRGFSGTSYLCAPSFGSWLIIALDDHLPGSYLVYPFRKGISCAASLSQVLARSIPLGTMSARIGTPW